jgi:PAS domain S-box-containing protein
VSFAGELWRTVRWNGSCTALVFQPPGLKNREEGPRARNDSMSFLPEMTPAARAPGDTGGSRVTPARVGDWKTNAGPVLSRVEDSDQERYRLAAIVESSEDAIISKNLDGIITSWNAGAETLFGYTAGEIVGQPISRLMPPEHKSDMNEILGKIRLGQRVEHFESVRLSKNGKHIPVSLSVSPIRDGTGRIIGAAKIARDITEQKKIQVELDRLYKEALEATRMRDEFLAVAGHELRTPLMALQLQLYTAQRRLDAGQAEKAAEGLQRAIAQFQRVARLTEDLLVVSQITAGRLELDLEDVDLAGIVAEVAERHRESASRAGSDLRIEASQPVTGRWDRSRLDQVITNLLANAIKFGGGKPIVLRVEAGPERARMTVVDQGIGISSADQSRIFERFERAVPKSSYGGMGLGLWISRQIVEAHGGRIGVVSEAGTGSTFHVELPWNAAKGSTP